MNKVWYLEKDEPIERLAPVGKNQIGKLHIDIPLKKPFESSPKKKKKTETEAKHQDDSQSSAPASSPSFFGSAMQNFMKNVLENFHVDLSNTNAEIMTTLVYKMEEFVEKKHQELLTEMNKKYDAMLEEQRAQGDLLRSLHARLDTLFPGSSTPMTTPPSVSVPPSEPGPSQIHTPISPSDLLFTMADPSSSNHEHIHITVDDPVQPFQPASTPVASPAGTEEVVISSSDHQSPDKTVEVEISSQVPEPQNPSMDLVVVPPLVLPDPEPSSSHTSSEDDSHYSGPTPLPVTPISVIRPSSSSSSHD